MKRVLLTGGSGFIGRNTIPFIKDTCQLYAPQRSELNLLDFSEVKNYLNDNNIDIVLNFANPNPAKNVLDIRDRMFEDSLRIFMNLFYLQDSYDFMYTLGSGAEFDKRRDLVSVSEKDETSSLPYDGYGLSKYIINQLISQNEKQCNLRLFGCYGPSDHESKFITHAIRCCLNNEDITIRQDCYFDYLHVYDFAKIIKYFIENKPHYKSYNVCSGKRVALSEIALLVKRLMNSDSNIVALKEGLNKEYTASNLRLLNEIGDFDFISLEEGIKIQIEYEKSCWNLK